MYTLFQGGSGSFSSSPRAEVWVPRFAVELPPWRKVFFGNLRDLLCSPFRRETPLPLTSRPGPFWTDVFVNRRLPIAPLRQSLLYHAFLIVALWGFSETWWSRPPGQARNPFENSRTVYYPVSEYLPPIEDDSGGPPAKVEQKGEPAYARQRIVSLPRHPDNRSQTIVTPSPLQIRHDVALPNIVALTPTPASIPAAVAAAMPARVSTPNLPAPVAPPPDIARSQLSAATIPLASPVAPPPAIDQISSKAQVFIPPAAVEPSPAVEQMSRISAFIPPTVVAPAPDAHLANTRAPAVPAPAVVEPPPSANSTRRLGDLNIAHMDPSVAAPPMPVPEQRAMWIQSGAQRLNQVRAAGVSGRPASMGADAAPPISLSGGGSSSQAVGQIVALGLNPVMPAGPVTVPEGNRRGTFAAGPAGKPGAPGTPEIHGGGVAEDPGGRVSGNGGAGNGGKDSLLAGITVAAGPVNPGPAAIAGPARAAVSAVTKAPATATPNAFLAALRPSRVSDLARRTHPGESTPDAPMVGDAVFGPKKYYSMMLNMPNLASVGGSWILRFAELHETREGGDLTAPVATLKVDPAYPPVLRRAGMEGVVVLYAVIRADGSVGDVRVLQGLDDRLDASARAALVQWRFRPATKNGNAVDLEAVVQIPFKNR